MSFEDLNLKENLLRGVYSYGFETPSTIQLKAIPIMYVKKDLIAQSQSGTGKTGAFTIGCLNIVDDSDNTQILILNPTRELADQTYNVINELSKFMDVSVVKVIGGTNIQECVSSLSKNPKIVVGTPGRVIDMIQKNHLFTDNIKTLVIDEADEMLSLGFIDSLQDIIRTLPRDTIINLFSATLPEKILEITTNFMNNPENILIKKENLTLEGIAQYYVNVNVPQWKYDILKDIFSTVNISQCIIYFNNKEKLNEVYDKLLKENYPVGCIHGSMDSRTRNDNLTKFKTGEIRMLLSSDLLSRGIDIQQLSLVINFDLPRENETYIHRIGRSGRYGRKGVAINFVLDRDIPRLEDLTKFYETQIQELPRDIENLL